MYRTISFCRPLLVAVMCTALTVLPVQKASAATLVDYGFLLFLIALALDVSPQADLPPGSGIVVHQLQTAAERAYAAHIIGDRTAEVSRLSKAIGAAEALTGMTSTCGNCGDLASTLQQTIGVAALLKTNAVGSSASCQPNGVIGPHEQCDPLAVPTGCLVDGVTLNYCSDECRCTSPL